MPNLTWKGKMQELRIQFEKQIEDLIEAKSLSEKKLKDVEKLNFNARKKIMTLQKELEGKDKTIGNLKADKAILEEKLDLFSLLVMRSFEFIKDLFSKTPSNSLSLQYMNIEDLFMPELGRILELNPHIEILDLEGNNITDKGIAEFLPSLLAFSGNLTRINLSFNKISANGAWDLFKTLQARENSLGKSIKKLDLSFNIFEEFEIYAKAWEATKEIRVNYPTIKTTKSDFINANSATLSKLFKNLCDKMFDNKEIKQLTYLLDKLEVKQDTEENTIAISIRNKKEIYDAYKSDFDVTARQKLLRNRISQLSLKRARLEDLEKPRELDINLLMAQRPAFILSYIKKTLDSGLKIDTVDKKLDETLLMYACRTNNLNLCKLLVNKLANLEIRNSRGQNAFLIACDNENYEIADFLILNRGKLTSADNKGANAMHLAIKEGKAHKILKLSEMGVSLNWKDLKKKTPLHYAAKLGDGAMAELLIKLGADANSLDVKGRSPAAYAEDKGKTYFLNAIVSMGGRKIRMAVGKEEFKSSLELKAE